MLYKIQELNRIGNKPFLKIDDFVKNPTNRHSRESGSPEPIEITGFSISQEWQKRQILTFYETIKIDSSKISFIEFSITGLASA